MHAQGPAGTRPPAATATTPSAGAAGAADAVGDASGGYLFPVLAYGPSNQVSGFKEAMALAKLLGRTLVVHDLAAHWRENTRAQIPMQQVRGRSGRMGGGGRGRQGGGLAGRAAGGGTDDRPLGGEGGVEQDCNGYKRYPMSVRVRWGGTEKGHRGEEEGEEEGRGKGFTCFIVCQWTCCCWGPGRCCACVPYALFAPAPSTAPPSFWVQCVHTVHYGV